jgi:hypothetical protein
MTINAAQLIVDRIEIEKLAFLFVRGNDIDASFFDQCLTKDVEVIYPFGEWKGLEEQKRHRDGSIGKTFAFTQSFLTNPIIDIDGDVAKAEYQVFAAHGKKAPEDKEIIYSGGIYTHDLVRTPDGWRIKRHHCKALWRSMTPAMPVTYR